MTVIELGDLASGSAPRTTPEFDARTPHRVAAALLILLCLFTLTASGRPEPLLVRTLWSTSLASDYRFTAGGDTLVATSQPGILTGYDLATGRRRWSFPMPEPSSYPEVTASAGVVLLSTGRLANQFLGADGTQYLAEYYRGTIGLDLHDGRRLWEADGSELAGSATGTMLLVDYAGDGSTVTGFRMIRQRDGVVLWSKPATVPLAMTAAGADPRRPDRVIAIAPDGATTVYGWSDGRELASGRVAWRQSTPGDGHFTEVFADGLNVYVRRADQIAGSVTAYALGDLRPRWTAPHAGGVGAYACGRIVCAFNPGTLVAYDPATGRPRWLRAGLQGADPAGDALLAQDGDDLAVYDPATGAIRGRPGVGTVVHEADTDQVILTRPTEDPPMRTSVSRVDLGTGEVSLRGAIARVGDAGCALSGDHLICGTLDGRLTVSRVAP
jgi:PQQ-like domain